jgi:hypothetical protein
MAVSDRGVAAPDEHFRRSFWRGCGATADEAAELVAYASSPIQSGPLEVRSYPFPDTPSTAAWEGYVHESRGSGALEVLRRVFTELRFPVQAGISQTETYRASVRRGLPVDGDGCGLSFLQPDGLRIFLHPTPAGRVPVVQTEAREDFETLVQAVTYHNEPTAVPPSVGACMVAGYNNWDRVAGLRRLWQAEHPGDANGQGWSDAFRELVPRKELYQDRFMLISSGPYSSTPAAALDLAEDAWRAASLTLRLEHECTHFFMREVFGAMRTSLLDELVADYMGLLAALGGFRADWFLLYMGLESYPAYRAGGRLENYRGKPPLSAGSFARLPGVVKRAAENLARLSSRFFGRDLALTEKAQLITAITRIGLEGLASEEVETLFGVVLDEAAEAVRRKAAHAVSEG